MLGFNKPADAASDFGADSFIVLKNVFLVRGGELSQIALGAH